MANTVRTEEKAHYVSLKTGMAKADEDKIIQRAQEILRSRNSSASR